MTSFKSFFLTKRILKVDLGVFQGGSWMRTMTPINFDEQISLFVHIRICSTFPLKLRIHPVRIFRFVKEEIALD